MHFLRLLWGNCLKQQLLVAFYRSTVESMLARCISLWYCGCSAADKKALQRVIKMAEKIIGHTLPALEDISTSRCLRKAGKFLKDYSHPGHGLFSRLPSGRRYRTLKSRTNRHKYSFVFFFYLLATLLTLFLSFHLSPHHKYYLVFLLLCFFSGHSLDTASSGHGVHSVSQCSHFTELWGNPIISLGLTAHAGCSWEKNSHVVSSRIRWHDLMTGNLSAFYINLSSRGDLCQQTKLKIL